VGVFVRAAWADDETVAFPRFWSAGVQASGPLPARRDDVLGLAVHQRRPSSRTRERVAPDAEPETGFEVYYATALLPWLVVTPDLQVILEPGGEPAETAVLATLRVRVTW
jgi:carbohydrate-selective porin OprB